MLDLQQQKYVKPPIHGDCRVQKFLQVEQNASMLDPKCQLEKPGNFASFPGSQTEWESLIGSHPKVHGSPPDLGTTSSCQSCWGGAEDGVVVGCDWCGCHRYTDGVGDALRNVWMVVSLRALILVCNVCEASSNAPR